MFIPIIFGKPLNVWLGVLLIPLLTAQIITGIAMVKGKAGVFKYHKIIALLIVLVAAAHVFYGLSLRFIK